MSRKASIIIGAVSLALLILILAPYLYVVWTRCDATIYAPGFSEAKFHQITKGMTKAEVEYIVGKPLRNDPVHVPAIIGKESRWLYAYLDCAKIPEPNDDRVTNTWYKVREIDFDKQERVRAILSSTEQFE